MRSEEFPSGWQANAILHSTPLAIKVPLALWRGVRGEAGVGGEAFIPYLPRLQRKDHLFLLDDMHKLHAGGKPKAREVAT